MSQLHSPRWDIGNNKGFGLDDKSTWNSTSLPPLSTCWTPISDVSILNEERGPHLNGQLNHKSSPIGCRLCLKASCRLKSHQAYYSARIYKSTHLSRELESCSYDYDTKPKRIDDLAIRTAFMKSYAFVEPSYLSFFQPSSFRLDVFHDLPIPGGDRPETHKLIRDFLNRHLYGLLSGPLLKSENVDGFQTLCLASAMMSYSVCISIIVTEKLIRRHAPGQKLEEHVAALFKEYEQCLWSIKGQPIDNKTIQIVSAVIISLCQHIILGIQESKYLSANTRSMAKGLVDSSGRHEDVRI